MKTYILTNHKSAVASNCTRCGRPHFNQSPFCNHCEDNMKFDAAVRNIH
jgi:uncharacterized OB-fold protein